MKQGKTISHKGVVKQVEKDKITVGISPRQACDTCSVKKTCSASEGGKERDIYVYVWDGDYREGEEVEVLIDKTQGFKTLFYAYVLPLLLIISTIVVTTTIFDNEITVALISLGVLVPYYLSLYLLRLKVESSLHFMIKKLI